MRATSIVGEGADELKGVTSAARVGLADCLHTLVPLMKRLEPGKRMEAGHLLASLAGNPQSVRVRADLARLLGAAWKGAMLVINLDTVSLDAEQFKDAPSTYALALA